MTSFDPRFLDEALGVARAAAAAAASVIARHYRTRLEVETKADETPVTIADREAEQAIKGVLKARYPDHAYYGEESGREGSGEVLWLIDPIDGTKSFIRGQPFFSTQIALAIDGELVLGVSRAPVYGEECWARRGGGAWRNGERIAVSLEGEIARAHLSFGNLRTIAADARWLALARLVRHAGRVRGYGDFCHYHLLAAGALDAVIESDVNILDIAALSVIVREAGGVITNLEGGEIALATTSVLAATPALHAKLLAAFAD